MLCRTGSDEESSKRNHCLLEINFDEFCTIMENCNFGVLANRQVFSVFDADGNGRIDVQEFLLALVSLRKRGSKDDVNEPKLYFDMFDLNGDGQICKVELGLVMDCLLYDGSGHDFLHDKTKNIDDVIARFDEDKSGTIEYEEFVRLYNFIMASSVKSNDVERDASTTSTQENIDESEIGDDCDINIVCNKEDSISAPSIVDLKVE